MFSGNAVTLNSPSDNIGFNVASTATNAYVYTAFTGRKDGANRYGILGYDRNSDTYKFAYSSSLAWETKGISINALGNVGIGTSNPSSYGRLHLADLTYGGIVLERTHATYPSKWMINPGHTSAAPRDLAFIDIDTSTPALLLSSDRVGIGGVLAPKATLHSTGSTIIGVDSDSVNFNNLGHGQMYIHVNYNTNDLIFTYKNATNGILKTATIPMT